MKLSQVLLRKRKMNTKPEAFVRGWQWNNAWYISQDRPVTKIGMKESLMERNIPCYQAEELLSPTHKMEPFTPIEIVETIKNKLPKDESHPLWQDRPAYSYQDMTWLPKNNQLQFATAITNTAAVNTMPDRIRKSLEDFSAPAETIYRLETLVKNAYIGDAVQDLLPRNFRVPYIGWDAVESKMRPRNLYDHTKNTWGRSMPREYGIPNLRKLKNLSRSLFMESLKISGLGTQVMASIDKEAHRQFITRPDGKLVRFNITVPLSLYGRKPLPPIVTGSGIGSLGATPVPSVAPMDPLATLHASNIYHPSSAHPISSTLHSHPFTHTVFNHYAAHVDPKWNVQAQKARSLMVGYCVALGQARLRYGEAVAGDLPEPVCVNVINTDGQRYQLATFQLNSVDLGSSLTNVFWTSPEPLELFQFCGYQEGQVTMTGLNLETFSHLHAVIADGAQG